VPELSTLNSQPFLPSHRPQGEGDQNEHLDGVEDAVDNDAGHFGLIEETPNLLERLVDFYASPRPSLFTTRSPRRFYVVRGAEKALVAARTSTPSRPPSSRRCAPPTKVQLTMVSAAATLAAKRY
jgi:hypothetical protein